MVLSIVERMESRDLVDPFFHAMIQELLPNTFIIKPTQNILKNV